MRPLSYADSDIVLLCFAVNSRTSFDNITSKWEPEVKHYVPEAKTILVGLKLDLRGEGAENVSTQEGNELAKNLGCETYIETSAVTKQGLSDVFEQSIETIFSKYNVVSGPNASLSESSSGKKQKKKGKCVLQ